MENEERFLLIFFRAYVEIFRAYVDSNASAYSTEILRETRNKYVEDTINLPAGCANTKARSAVRQMWCTSECSLPYRTDRCSKRHSHSSRRRKGGI